jgi:hypothetical protein
LTKDLGILAATDAIVILYNPLGETWAPQLDIASDRKPRKLVRKSVDLPGPVRVLKLGHRASSLVIQVELVLPALKVANCLSRPGQSSL